MSQGSQGNSNFVARTEIAGVTTKTPDFFFCECVCTVTEKIVISRTYSYFHALPTSVIYEVFQHFWQFWFCVAQSFTKCSNNHYCSALRVIIFSGQFLKLIQDHMNLALIKEISTYNSVGGSLYCHCKGQLISKCLLGVTISTKKTNEKFLDLISFYMLYRAVIL